MSWIAAVVGRVFIALIFILSGIQKLIDPSGAEAMLSAVGLPAYFGLITGAFELICGLLLAVGLMTRVVAILLAGFCLVTIFFFHNRFTDPVQGTMALKNLAMAGGLLAVFAYGQVRGTFDAVREERKRHKAELEAAHAKGEAEGATRANKPIKV